MSFYVCHYLIWCEAKKKSCVLLVRVTFGTSCILFLYFLTLYQHNNNTKSHVSLDLSDRGNKRYYGYFPRYQCAVVPPLYCTSAAKPLIMTKAESSDHPGCSCNIYHRTKAVKKTNQWPITPSTPSDKDYHWTSLLGHLQNSPFTFNWV